MTTIRHFRNDANDNAQVYNITRRRSKDRQIVSFDECKTYKGNTRSEVYLVHVGQCLEILNTDTYFSLFLYSLTITVPQHDMDSCPKGKPIPVGSIFIGETTSRVYLMINEVSPVAKDSCNPHQTKILKLPHVIISSLPTTFTECAVYTGDPGSKVYLVLNGECHWIPNKETFFNLFNSWSVVNSIPQKDMDLCPMGRDIENGAALVKSFLAGEVYLMNHEARHIADIGTFDICNFDASKIKVLPASIIRSAVKKDTIKL